jgi:hypothetical protein
MFGLEEQKGKGKHPKDFTFDLESDLKNAQKSREIKDKVEKKIQMIKQILRNGENKEEFDQLGVLLHGYTSLQKVISRFASK